MSAGQATCVQSANMGQRQRHSLASLCVPLPVVGTIRDRASSGFCGGARARGIQVSVQAGLFGQVRKAFSGCHLSPGLSQSRLFRLPLSLPLSVHLFHFRLSGSSVHSSVLTCVLVIHTHSDPFLAAIIAPAGTFHHPRTILAPCPMSFPFTLPSAARSPLTHLLQIFPPRLPPSLCSLFTPHPLSSPHSILSCPLLPSSAPPGSERPQS